MSNFWEKDPVAESANFWEKDPVAKEGMLDRLGNQLSKEVGSVKNAGDVGTVLSKGLVGGTLGAPVDIINMGLQGADYVANKLTGAIRPEAVPYLPKLATEAPVGGSQWINKQMANAGIVGQEERPLLEAGSSLLPVTPAAVKGGINVAKAGINAAKAAPAAIKAAPDAIMNTQVFKGAEKGLTGYGDTALESIDPSKIKFAEEVGAISPRQAYTLENNPVPKEGQFAQATAEDIAKGYNFKKNPIQASMNALLDFGPAIVSGGTFPVPLSMAKKFGTEVANKYVAKLARDAINKGGAKTATTETGGMGAFMAPKSDLSGTIDIPATQPAFTQNDIAEMMPQMMNKSALPPEAPKLLPFSGNENPAYRPGNISLPGGGGIAVGQPEARFTARPGVALPVEPNAQQFRPVAEQLAPANPADQSTLPSLQTPAAQAALAKVDSDIAKSSVQRMGEKTPNSDKIDRRVAAEQAAGPTIPTPVETAPAATPHGQALQQELTANPDLAPYTQKYVVPENIKYDVADFTAGRSKETVAHGGPGTGKTSLATDWLEKNPNGQVDYLHNKMTPKELEYLGESLITGPEKRLLLADEIDKFTPAQVEKLRKMANNPGVQVLYTTNELGKVPAGVKNGSTLVNMNTMLEPGQKQAFGLSLADRYGVAKTPEEVRDIAVRGQSFRDIKRGVLEGHQLKKEPAFSFDDPASATVPDTLKDRFTKFNDNQTSTNVMIVEPSVYKADKNWGNNLDSWVSETPIDTALTKQLVNNTTASPTIRVVVRDAEEAQRLSALKGLIERSNEGEYPVKLIIEDRFGKLDPAIKSRAGKNIITDKDIK